MGRQDRLRLRAPGSAFRKEWAGCDWDGPAGAGVSVCRGGRSGCLRFQHPGWSCFWLQMGSCADTHASMPGLWSCVLALHCNPSTRLVWVRALMLGARICTCCVQGAIPFAHWLHASLCSCGHSPLCQVCAAAFLESSEHLAPFPPRQGRNPGAAMPTGHSPC